MIFYINSSRLKVEIAQLDAEKAFDTLWRVGLYHKLMNVVDPVYFRALVTYYGNSQIIIKYNGDKSNKILINDGVKQGGILSGYLFNYYMNDLITNCVNLNIGCKIGEHNVSMIAYCDDLFLMAPTKEQMDILLKEVENYSVKWKIKFNINKCINLTLHPAASRAKKISKLFLNGKQLTQSRSIIHLGLPIGPNFFIKNYWKEKMKSTVRAFYSLNGIGLRPFAMNPLTMAKIYRIYCQPKFLYGLEMVHINKTTLNELNSSQATLIKMNLTLSKYALSTPLMNALRIETIKHLYFKFKILFVKQLKRIPLTSAILDFLEVHYLGNAGPEQSFLSQTAKANQLLGIDILRVNTQSALKKLNEYFQTTDQELVNKILNLCTMMFE